MGDIRSKKYCLAGFQVDDIQEVQSEAADISRKLTVSAKQKTGHKLRLNLLRNWGQEGKKFGPAKAFCGGLLLSSTNSVLFCFQFAIFLQ